MTDPATDPFSEAEWQRLLALADEVIPHDEYYSASETGFREFLTRNHEDALRGHDAELRALLAGDNLANHAWFVQVVGESYYADPANGGNYGSASFRMIDFEYEPPVDIPHVLVGFNETPLAELLPRYDAVVIGSGAGGGVISRRLTEAGLQVLCVEKGRLLQRADVSMDHLRNHRFARYGHNVGPDPDGHPRTLITRSGRRLTTAAIEPGYGNNAMGVGGGTRVWGAQAWRFAPLDFRMATTYGVPTASSLADWPISYQDLAPHYDWVEKHLGVAGEPGHAWSGERQTQYPMSPGDTNASGALLGRAASQLGWVTRAPPLAINTTDYMGRGPCANNRLCVGFACPSNARGGSQNTMLPAAFATGHFTLATETQALGISKPGTGGAREVSLINAQGAQRTVRADRVICAAGAIESARLLLASGFGETLPHLGRHLQAHLYTGAVGEFDEPVANGPGPGPTIATCQFNHGNDGIVGGGMIANDFPVLPVQFWTMYRSRAPAPYGLENKAWMARAYRRTQSVMGPTQEIPNPESRVRLDPVVRDCHGMPVAQLSGTVHDASLQTGRFMRERAREWLLAAGAHDVTVFGAETGNHVSAGQHQAGTCRMGHSAEDSVTSHAGRVHGTTNLYVADASLHVTNGGFNPALTVMALASSVASGIIGEMTP